MSWFSIVYRLLSLIHVTYFENNRKHIKIYVFLKVLPQWHLIPKAKSELLIHVAACGKKKKKKKMRTPTMFTSMSVSAKHSSPQASLMSTL